MWTAMNSLFRTKTLASRAEVGLELIPLLCGDGHVLAALRGTPNHSLPSRPIAVPPGSSCNYLNKGPVLFARTGCPGNGFRPRARGPVGLRNKRGICRKYHQFREGTVKAGILADVEAIASLHS